MPERTFSLDEAQNLIPVLESLLRSAMQGKQLIHEVEEELQAIGGRIFHSGGATIDVVHFARRKAQREKAVQSVKDSLAEIDATGVQVKDLDIGLLDFPCLVDDQVILLCWKLGEEKITHWHGVDEGFRGRKPIDDRILKANKRRKSN